MAGIWRIELRRASLVAVGEVTRRRSSAMGDVGRSVASDPSIGLVRRHTGTVTATLVYDGDCGICQLSVDLLARAGSTAVAVPSWQWIGEHPAHAELCATTVLFVDADGSVAVEESAVAAVLRTTKRPLSWLAPVITAPGLRSVSRALYRAVSRNRARLSKAIGRASCAVDPGGSERP